MDKVRTNIAIVEPSLIIFEGLSSILLHAQSHFYIYRLSEIDELNDLMVNERFDVIIANPSTLQNKQNEFVKIRRNQPDLFWIGLVYSYFDNELISKFDEIINITSTSEIIVDKIKGLLNRTRDETYKHEQLSEREIDVLILLVKGLANKEIAEKLNISIHTVISHRKNITEKTGIKSLSGLTIYAISKKIIPLDTTAF